MIEILYKNITFFIINKIRFYLNMGYMYTKNPDATLSIAYTLNNYKKKYHGNSAAQDDINRF